MDNGKQTLEHTTRNSYVDLDGNAHSLESSLPAALLASAGRLKVITVDARRRAGGRQVVPRGLAPPPFRRLLSCARRPSVAR